MIGRALIRVRLPEARRPDMRRTYWLMLSLPALVGGCVLSLSGGAEPPPRAKPDIPKEVRALAGTYTGAWTMYGIDEKGEVVKRMAWTDTMKAGSPEVKGER